MTSLRNELAVISAEKARRAAAERQAVAEGEAAVVGGISATEVVGAKEALLTQKYEEVKKVNA